MLHDDNAGKDDAKYESRDLHMVVRSQFKLILTRMKPKAFSVAEVGKFWVCQWKSKENDRRRRMELQTTMKDEDEE